METHRYNRLLATVLAISTVALVILAVFNFLQESQYQQPDDGVQWTEVSAIASGQAVDGLVAEHVRPGGPGALAGIEPGDLLIAVNNHPVEIAADFDRELKHTDVYGKANYTIIRRGIALDAPVVVIPIPADTSLRQLARAIGLIYLAIGLYVLFRRWTAPRATHFYLFCLTSFALNAFHYTGQLDALDWTIYWGNIVAGALQPALFLHFALVFPEERLRRSRRGWLVPFLYAPAVAVIALQAFALLFWQATLPTMTAVAIPGPNASLGFSTIQQLYARLQPETTSTIYPLFDLPFVSKAFFDEAIVVAMPQTAAGPFPIGNFAPGFTLTGGDMIDISIGIPESTNPNDYYFGPDNVFVKYIGMTGTGVTGGGVDP